MQWSKRAWNKNNYEEKDMIPLTDSEEQEKCCIFQKEFCYDKNEKNKKKKKEI